MKVEKAEREWILCTERMPEEVDSIFAKFYGTDRWSKSMFRKRSREVIATVKYKDGSTNVRVAHTNDGEWNIGINVTPINVIAWMPMPEPYREG